MEGEQDVPRRPEAGAPGGKNIVICCDGTGNEIGVNLSNVLKLYRILEKSERQRVFYNPGVGTIAQQNAWQRLKQTADGVFRLATGQGLDDDILGAYRFLCQNYQPGDKVWLFGFSRGAYTVRVLAAFTYVIGLLPPDQLNLAGYALSAYKRSSAQSRKQERRAEKAGAAPASVRSESLEAAWDFGRVAGGRPILFEFVGVWDTVASIIVPRSDSFVLDLQTLRFTRTNPMVKSFRQAIAIDERRRLFRLNYWTEPQRHRQQPFDRDSEIDQDIRQVWFAGAHGDVGGGYPETQSAVSKFPLHWMIEQAAEKGLHVDRRMIDHLVLGKPRAGGKHTYVPPDIKGPIHDPMNVGWRILEWLPKQVRWREWPTRRDFFGWYLPRSEPRVIPGDALIHWSAIARRDAGIGYAPVNLPAAPRIEQEPAITAAERAA